MTTLLIILAIFIFLAYVGRALETAKRPKIASGPTVNAKAVTVSAGSGCAYHFNPWTT